MSYEIGVKFFFVIKIFFNIKIGIKLKNFSIIVGIDKVVFW